MDPSPPPLSAEQRVPPPRRHTQHFITPLLDASGQVSRRVLHRPGAGDTPGAASLAGRAVQLSPQPQISKKDVDTALQTIHPDSSPPAAQSFDYTEERALDLFHDGVSVLMGVDPPYYSVLLDDGSAYKIELRESRLRIKGPDTDNLSTIQAVLRAAGTAYPDLKEKLDGYLALVSSGNPNMHQISQEQLQQEKALADAALSNFVEKINTSRDSRSRITLTIGDLASRADIVARASLRAGPGGRSFFSAGENISRDSLKPFFPAATVKGRGALPAGQPVPTRVEPPYQAPDSLFTSDMLAPSKLQASLQGEGPPRDQAVELLSSPDSSEEDESSEDEEILEKPDLQPASLPAAGSSKTSTENHEKIQAVWKEVEKLRDRKYRLVLTDRGFEAKKGGLFFRSPSPRKDDAEVAARCLKQITSLLRTATITDKTLLEEARTTLINSQWFAQTIQSICTEVSGAERAKTSKDDAKTATRYLSQITSLLKEQPDNIQLEEALTTLMNSKWFQTVVTENNAPFLDPLVTAMANAQDKTPFLRAIAKAPQDIRKKLNGNSNYQNLILDSLLANGTNSFSNIVKNLLPEDLPALCASAEAVVGLRFSDIGTVQRLLAVIRNISSPAAAAAPAPLGESARPSTTPEEPSSESSTGGIELFQLDPPDDE